MKEYGIERIEDVDGHTRRVTINVTVTPPWLMRLFGAKEETYTRVFYGDCTVWHHEESGRRASTSWESFLADLVDHADYLEEREKSP